MAEPVRADSKRIESTLNRSYEVWSSYAHEAEATSELPISCFQLRNVLGKAPEYRIFRLNKNGATSPLKLDGDGTQLYGSGRFIWQLSGGVCSLAEKELHHKLIFGTTQATSFTFTDDSRFTNWHTFQDLSGGNSLSILASAWAYVLSAKWVEIQTPFGADIEWPRGRIEYHQLEDRLGDDSPGDIMVDLGCIGDDAARWWAAVLAPGEGWIATRTIEGVTYRSPWSVQIADNQRFTFQRPMTNPSFPSRSDPPSSSEAVRYLHDFCVTHNICDQGLAALAAALHFPALTGHTLLPQPRSPRVSITGSTAASSNSTTPSTKIPSILEEYERLPYYMMLSCNPRGMLALLGGSFFDVAIECNVVSSWLEPIFAIIDPIIRKHDYKTFVTMMAKRQLSLASLWLGATIVGLERQIIQMARLGTPPVDLHAGAWTGTAHSFIAVVPSRPVLPAEEVRRSDECRILFLAGSEDHNAAPICPWQPFGTIRLRDTDLEVQQHVRCGHAFEYVRWEWDLRNGSSGVDQGYSARANEGAILVPAEPPSDLVPSLRSEVASEVATRSIFSWLRVEGWPTAERGIRTHEWFDLGESDQDSDSGSDAGDDVDGLHERIED